jgi:hypothetical protein
MDLEVIILSEVNKKKTNIYYRLYVESKFLKNDANELIYQAETNRVIETNLWLSKGKHGEEG